MRLTTLFLILFMTLVSCQEKSNLKLPSLIGDNMVLQQKTDAKIWGKAAPGQKISVSASWNVNGQTKATKDGKWMVILPTPDAGGPYTVTITAKDTAVLINNVLIGEVWFCSGQSNMEMPLEGWPPVDTIMHSAETIATASIPEIRMFNVTKRISGVPLEDCEGSWQVSTPETVRTFSATGYFFGRKLYSELHLPVGLIESAWGGTPAESWISAETLEESGEFIPELKAMKESMIIRAEYKAWLNTLKQVEVVPGGTDQWKNLVFDDDKIPAPQYNDSSWPEMVLPSVFEKTLGEFDGVVWFRKQVTLSKDMAGKDLILSLGPIDDMDRTYFNGKLIGSTEESGFWQVDRNYEVPGFLVNEGVNDNSCQGSGPSGWRRYLWSL